MPRTVTFEYGTKVVSDFSLPVTISTPEPETDQMTGVAKPESELVVSVSVSPRRNRVPERETWSATQGWLPSK